MGLQAGAALKVFFVSVATAIVGFRRLGFGLVLGLFAVGLFGFGLVGCTLMSRKEMSCPSVASSSADHKYYCVIGDKIETKFRELVDAKIAESPELQSVFADLHAEAELRLDREGNVKGVWLPKRSGNKEFDELAKQALNESSPLPQPPEALFKDGNTLKIFWDFRLSE